LLNKENANNYSQDIEDKEKEDVKTLPKSDRFKENVQLPPKDADNEDLVVMIKSCPIRSALLHN
jgi:hypothetical protein